jgi:hypothetical protein
VAEQLQPDTGEVLQEEPYVMAVTGAVTVAGPVRTQELPRKGAATRTRTVTDTQYVQVLEADPRRASVLLMSMDQEMYVGFSEASMQAPESAATVWPAGVPFPLSAAVDVYVMCAATGQTTRVSVTSFLWAQG